MTTFLRFMAKRNCWIRPSRAFGLSGSDLLYCITSFFCTNSLWTFTIVSVSFTHLMKKLSISFGKKILLMTDRDAWQWNRNSSSTGSSFTRFPSLCFTMWASSYFHFLTDRERLSLLLLSVLLKDSGWVLRWKISQGSVNVWPCSFTSLLSYH